MVSLRLAILCVVVGATLGLLVPGEFFFRVRTWIVGGSETSAVEGAAASSDSSFAEDAKSSADLGVLSNRIAGDIRSRENDLGGLRREAASLEAELLRTRAGHVLESATGPASDPAVRRLVASLARRREAVARMEAEVRELQGLGGRLDDERDRVAVGSRVAALRSSEDARRAVARLEAETPLDDVAGSMAAAGRVEAEEMGATLPIPETGSWPAQKRWLGALTQEAERRVHEGNFAQAEEGYTEILDRLRGFGPQAAPLIEAIGVRLEAVRVAARERDRRALDTRVGEIADRLVTELEGAAPDLSKVVGGCEAILDLSLGDGFASATLRSLARRADLEAPLRARVANALRWVAKPVGSASRVRAALARTDASLASGHLEEAEAALREATEITTIGEDVSKRRAAVEGARAALLAADTLRVSLLRGEADGVPAALRSAEELIHRSPIWAEQAGLPRAVESARASLEAAERRRGAELELHRVEGASVKTPDDARRFLDGISKLPAASRGALESLVSNARSILEADRLRADAAVRAAALDEEARVAARGKVTSALADGKRLVGHAPAEAEAKFHLVEACGDAEQKALEALGLADAARVKGDLEPSRRMAEFARAIRAYESLAATADAPEAVRANALGWASVLHARFAAGYARAARTGRSSRTAAESRRHFEAARTGLAVLERTYPSIADSSTGLPWARRVRDELATTR